MNTQTISNLLGYLEKVTVKGPQAALNLVTAHQELTQTLQLKVMENAVENAAPTNNKSARIAPKRNSK